jgi:hypothetical protein
MQYKPTEDFARDNAVKAGSVRSRYCREGSYFGVKPHKLANGRLLWPVTETPQPAGEQGADK